MEQGSWIGALSKQQDFGSLHNRRVEAKAAPPVQGYRLLPRRSLPRQAAFARTKAAIAETIGKGGGHGCKTMATEVAALPYSVASTLLLGSGHCLAVKSGT